MTQRDGTERGEEGRFRMGNTCIPVADSGWYMAKPIQHCKAKNKIKKELFCLNFQAISDAINLGHFSE